MITRTAAESSVSYEGMPQYQMGTVLQWGRVREDAEGRLLGGDTNLEVPA